jgi:hypothetical protein
LYRKIKAPFAKEISKAFNTAILIYNNTGGATLAILQLVDKYEFGVEILKDIIVERDLQVSFSNVKFDSIASRVGLRKDKGLQDLDRFTIHRERLPNALFTQIMDTVHSRYKNTVGTENSEYSYKRSSLARKGRFRAKTFLNMDQRGNFWGFC